MNFFNEITRNYICSVTNLEKDFSYEQFKVGRSNITFKIKDQKNSYVLRRPPFGEKLESAHNMQREYKILKELYRNNLKVPEPIALCSDMNISNDDFFIMEYIEGETISDNLVAKKYSKKEKESISVSFINSLVELHNFDVLNSNLSDLGKHENYVIRQIQRWNKQFNAQKIRDIKDIDTATQILIDTIPVQQQISIVHGDYRLDNVRIKNEKVAAILDWELCTLGDPLADLGTIIASWANNEEKDTPFIYSPSLSGGFLTRKELLAIYEKETNLDLKDIEFYVRLSFWKHAMIMEGVYVRYSLGYYGDTNKNDIEAFANSTIAFAKKASNINLLEEIL
ncbi:MAG: phosphotransferase family protein [Candidatus Actinomarina sp.]|jgi:aminoglycoside phosphotransferase (APT) family kinase protein|nr:phosphotransferase family protein [Actinomycetota bacterium]MBL6837151.1 phosphotransferase family protein [Candidatus Actinomarina sp.]